jgi:hypothetical protein
LVRLSKKKHLTEDEAHTSPYKNRPMPMLRPASPTRRRGPKPDRNRALELLAGCGTEGCTEAILLARSFTVEQIVELVRAGLARATAEHVAMGRRTLEVARVRITEEGLRALAEARR